MSFFSCFVSSRFAFIALTPSRLVSSAKSFLCRIWYTPAPFYMFSIGKTAPEMDFFPDCVWLGIPLSISGKNIFFDRGIFHD
ncbi:MAG: ferredoxin domain-containing protein [Anaerotignum sp.]|nr:ferredoxin domain-containing protein [Anaerotignum sp.]MCI8867092.1 ferredoxin domain-containing protein [Anaerotignum sp.]